jgi:hypothetical protein
MILIPLNLSKQGGLIFLGLDWKAKTERDRDNGNAMGHDPVDGKDGVGGSDWVGFFLLDYC